MGFQLTQGINHSLTFWGRDGDSGKRRGAHQGWVWFICSTCACQDARCKRSAQHQWATWVFEVQSHPVPPYFQGMGFPEGISQLLQGVTKQSLCSRLRSMSPKSADAGLRGLLARGLPMTQLLLDMKKGVFRAAQSVGFLFFRDRDSKQMWGSATRNRCRLLQFNSNTAKRLIGGMQAGHVHHQYALRFQFTDLLLIQNTLLVTYTW